MSSKLGFLNIGHRDYPNDIARMIADKAVENLRKVGIEVSYKDMPIVDPITARNLALELVKEDLDGVIIFLGTWIECPVAISAIREIEHLPFALWGYPQFIRGEDTPFVKKGEKDSTGSYVALTVLKGTLDRMGYRYFWIVGFPDDKRALERATIFSRIAYTMKTLKRVRIGLIGYASMGMYPGTFDHALLRRFIGPEVIQFDTYTLINRIERIKETKQTIGVLKEKAHIHQDATEEKLEKVARMYKALKELSNEYYLDAVNVKCQYELSQEYGAVACIPCSLLADSGIVTTCEGDVMTTVSAVIMHLITNQVIYYGDILDWEDGRILLSSCGFMPFSLSKYKPTIRELGYPGFKGLINSGVLKEGEITMVRLYEGIGSYKMSIVKGEGIDTKPRMGRFPALNIKVNFTEEEFLEYIPSQHYCIAYGDWIRDLEELCKFMGIGKEVLR
ncbi:MAG: L-fucose/L-arabinose isomerase family protein [bacterium]